MRSHSCSCVCFGLRDRVHSRILFPGERTDAFLYLPGFIPHGPYVFVLTVAWTGSLVICNTLLKESTSQHPNPKSLHYSWKVKPCHLKTYPSSYHAALDRGLGAGAGAVRQTQLSRCQCRASGRTGRHRCLWSWLKIHSVRGITQRDPAKKSRLN